MRHRKHFIGFWLDDMEYQHFHRQCQISGLNASAFVRKSILGVELRPRPPDEVAALVRELHAIGNNANQIAYWANAQKSITEPELRQVASLVYEAARLVKERL